MRFEEKKKNLGAGCGAKILRVPLQVDLRASGFLTRDSLTWSRLVVGLLLHGVFVEDVDGFHGDVRHVMQLLLATIDPEEPLRGAC